MTDFLSRNIVFLFFLFGVAMMILVAMRSFRAMKKREEKLREIAQALGLSFRGSREVLDEEIRKAKAQTTTAAAENLIKYEKMARFGLSLVGSYELFGNFRGLPVVVRINQNKQDYFTSIHVSFPKSLGLGLRLRRQTWLAPVEKLLTNATDEQLGDAELDKKFIIEAASAAKARELLLQSNIKTALLKLVETLNRELELRDEWLLLKVPNQVVLEEAEMRELLEDAAAAAKTIVGKSDF